MSAEIEAMLQDLWNQATCGPKPDMILVSTRTHRQIRRAAWGKSKPHSRRKGAKGRKASIQAARQSRGILGFIERHQ